MNNRGASELFRFLLDPDLCRRFNERIDRRRREFTQRGTASSRMSKRRIRVEKSGSASTVVWNPWITKAQQMSDFGNEEYRQVLCVESGNVAKNKLTLAPGKSSVLKVVLSSVPL